MTGCYLQEYQEDSIKTVKKHLFFVSVCVLQLLSRTVPFHDLGTALSTSLNVSECVPLQRHLRVAPNLPTLNQCLPVTAAKENEFFTHP